MFDIAINNSFNKSENSNKNEEYPVSDSSTLNKSRHIHDTISTSATSITISPRESHNVMNFDSKGTRARDGWIRDIIVGTISAVLGSIITYMIFGLN